MTKNQNLGSGALPVADLAKLLGASLGPALRLVCHPATLRQWPRLLHEDIDPIVHLLIRASNTALIHRWLNNGTKVVFISSFLRSGNTWMRFMLSDVLLQMYGVETSTQLPVHPNDLIPEFRFNSIPRRLTRCPPWAFRPPVAFVKTHFLFSQLEEILSGNGRPSWGMRSEDAAPFRDCRILYLYRAPEDALVSFYHFCHRDAYWRNRATNGIDAFCRTEVSWWMENMSSYLRAAGNGVPIFFASYESLLEKPAIVLSDLLHWLGMPHDAQMVNKAVSNMQFGKLQKMEIQTNKTRDLNHQQNLFFRRGCSGSGHAELQESTLLEIRQKTASLFSQADHRRMIQPSHHHGSPTVVPNPSDATASLRNGKSHPNGKAAESIISPRLQQL
jgi:hypothetical protein